jgi:hypothetical protein
MTELWPIFVEKLRFFTVHCISDFVRSGSFFLWSCSRAVGIPTGNFSSSDDGNGGKMGIFLDLALDLANFNLYTKILFFNRSLYIEYRPIELIFLVELY